MRSNVGVWWTILLVTALVAARGTNEARAQGAPPPSALTCRVAADCPTGATCSVEGICVKRTASDPPTTPPPPSVSPPPASPPPSVAPPIAAGGPTSQQLADAKLHYDQAVALFNDRNFTAALAEFVASYQLYANAAVLRSIGLTQKELFQYAEAIATLSRYLEQSTSATVEIRAETERIIAELRALLAPVTMTVTPVGAVLGVDGTPIGRAPFTAPVLLPPGSHTISVTADGFEPAQRTIVVTAQVAQTVEIALATVATTGKVRVTASVTGAEVKIDGEPVGRAPLELELESGGHSIEVVAAGHKPHRGELSIAVGQDRTVDVRLDKESGGPRKWYQKWYVVAPIAVVVSGAALGLAINYGTTEAPITGTLSPGVQEVR